MPVPGGAVPPFEIEAGIVAAESGLARQSRIVEILAVPDERAAAHGNPRERRQSGAQPVEILHPDEMVAGRHVDLSRPVRRHLSQPLVDEELAVDPEAHPVVGERRKAIPSGAQIQRARPAGGKPGPRQPAPRSGRPKVKVHRAVVAGKAGIALQVRIAKVFAAPIGKVRRDHLETGLRAAGMMIVFHPDRVKGLGQIRHDRVCGRRLVGPCVDDQVVVHVQPDAVVVDRRQGPIAGSIDIDPARPANREIGGGECGGRGGAAPCEIDVCILPGQGRIALKVGIGKIDTGPSAGGLGRRYSAGRGRRRERGDKGRYEDERQENGRRSRHSTSIRQNPDLATRGLVADAGLSRGEFVTPLNSGARVASNLPQAGRQHQPRLGRRDAP